MGNTNTWQSQKYIQYQYHTRSGENWRCSMQSISKAQTIGNRSWVKAVPHSCCHACLGSAALFEHSSGNGRVKIKSVSCGGRPQVVPCQPRLHLDKLLHVTCQSCAPVALNSPCREKKKRIEKKALGTKWPQKFCPLGTPFPTTQGTRAPGTLFWECWSPLNPLMPTLVSMKDLSAQCSWCSKKTLLEPPLNS